MDFTEIDSIMVSKGIAADPAFDALHFLVETIPSFNGCPLGLYYPDTATIILPPDGTISALLHELGHRHGHYYYDDLSEGYAENYRKGYEKGKALLYSGNHIENLPKFGALFNEGERGAVEIALAYLPGMDELYAFKSRVLSHQVHEEKAPRFFYGGDDNPWVRVEFTQGADWMVIIGASLAALATAGVGAIAYAIYKVAKEVPWVFPVATFGAIAGALLLAEYTRKRLLIRA